MKRLGLLLFPLFFLLIPHARAQSSQDGCRQGACYGYGAPTGSCVGAFVYSDISQTPIQAYSCFNGAWGKSGGSGGATLKPAVSLFVIGDSYLLGVGATVPNATSVYPLLARDTPAINVGNSSVSGQGSGSVSMLVAANFNPDPNNPSVTLVSGANNDAFNDTCSTTTTVTPCVINFENAMSFIQAWTTIPFQFRQMASTATSTGSWAPDSTLPIYSNPNIVSPGTPESSTTSGSTLTFSIPSSASTQIGVTYEVVNGQTGTFTIKIDGTNQTDDCSGTTTFSSGPCTAWPTSAFIRQGFTVTGGTTHTVVITTTNSNKSDTVSVDWIPPAGTANENAVFVLGTDAIFPPVIYNTYTGIVANALKALGLQDYFVDLQNGTPGVNATTDLSTTATATCPASLLNQHPNDCGYLHMLQTINSTELANNYVFSSFGAGGKAASLNGVVNVPLKVAGIGGTIGGGYSQLCAITLVGCGVTFYGPDSSNNIWGDGVTNLPGSSQPWSNASSNLTFGTNGWNCDALKDRTLNTGPTDFTAVRCTNVQTGDTYQLGMSTATRFVGFQGAAIASATTIAPTAETTHITGTTSIATITPPAGCTTGLSCAITLIPDGLWSTLATGNIAIGSTGVVSKALILTYDATTAKWYPSY